MRRKLESLRLSQAIWWSAIGSAVAGVAPGLEWNAGSVRSEGEVNSIFTAENAEDRRELQREK
jgi:hypothetical protein